MQETQGSQEQQQQVKGLTAESPDQLEQELAMLTLTSMAKPVLGPRIETQVLVDGVEVTALIDTGSPVSIMSSNCFFQVCCNKTPPGENWKERARAVKRKPSVQLRAYNNDPVEVDAEMDTIIQRGR